MPEPLLFTRIVLGGLLAAGLWLAVAAPATEPLGPSSRRTGWVISEIMYHPPDRADGRNVEFIEIYNSQPIAESLGGFRLAGEVDYTFPADTVVPAGSFMVVAANPVDVAAVYGIRSAPGGFTGRLSNRAGAVRLIHRSGAILLAMEYSGEPPWPAAADGAGHSLALSVPSLGEGHPAAWSASAMMGGSPGSEEPANTGPLSHVMINELLANPQTSALDFVELYNHSPQTVDVSGCLLTDDPTTNRFRLPGGTVIPAGGLVAFGGNALGFGLDAGETVFLLNSNRTWVIDAVRYGAPAEGISTGRFPDGAVSFHELSSPSRGAANRPRLIRAVVINEIMFHPISEKSEDEYVELFNRGSNAVDLAGWQFVDGIEFTFPPASILAVGGYLVVAKSSGHLITNHPNLKPANTVGEFQGNLSNRGERLALARPQLVVRTNASNVVVTSTHFVVVDEVTYGDGGNWGNWSDGGGSSLELIDPRSDHRRAFNWADSDETAKSSWTLIEHTGTLDLGTGGIDSLQILLQGAGECLIDQVEVLGAGTGNLIANSTFENGITGWFAQGTHDASGWEPGEGFQSASALHVRAVARGDTGANRIRTSLNSTLNPGSTATIRARARWLRGHPEVLLRLRGNYLEAFGRLEVPSNLGTPGARNSRAADNAGPAIDDVAHFPVLPAANQSVIVTARAHDPDGISSFELKYRLDPATNLFTVNLADNGTGGDAVAGDGIYSATIPGQAGGGLIAFHLNAWDHYSPRAPTAFPKNAPRHEGLIRFGEAQPAGSLATYRLWMTQATFNRWATRPKLDNQPLEVTFVYGNERVVHNVGALYAGSPHISPSYTTPAGNLCGYILLFPADDPFLGATEVVLDWPGRDATAQQEQVAFWIGNEIGLPFSHRRYLRLHVNGVTETQRGSIYEDAQQIDSDFVESWVPNALAGDLFKIEQWFEFTDDLVWSHIGPPRLENYTTTGGAKKLARYRWNWLKRAVGDSANDYRHLFALVDAVNAGDAQGYTAQVEAVADPEQWMRTFAVEQIVVNLDSYGYDIGKNMYACRPEDGRWQMFMWDIDWVMTASAQHGYSPQSPLFYRGPTRFGEPYRDPTIGRMYDHPPFQRAFWRAIQDAVHGPLRRANVEPRMDEMHAALVANGVTASAGFPLSSPAPVKTWIQQRRDYLLQQLDTVAAPLAITSHGGRDFSTDQNPLSLTGTAPVEVKTIQVNGAAPTLAWTTVTHWSLAVALTAGHNVLTFQGFDLQGRPLAGARAAVTVTWIPVNPLSPRILAAAIDPQGQITLTWSARPGKSYRVQFKHALTDSPWTDLAGDVSAGQTQAAKTDSMGAGNRQRFYRVMLLDP